ncbi:MAG: hypothetical protein GC162_09100 [Planctomycetes bacterium]|nr:hypothetical protein [Planctomycetota bacterium]
MQNVMRKNVLLCLFILIALVVFSMRAHGQVTLSPVFASNMVLQQGKPIHLWGRAAADEAIDLTLGDAHATARADRDGRWAAELPAMNASKKPMTLTVAASNRITLSNVLVGEVWVMAGGADMKRDLRFENDSDKLAALVGESPIRIYDASPAVADEPKDQLAGEWKAVNAGAARLLSAEAMLFAQRLGAALDAPVGVIVLAAPFPGSPIEAWISHPALEAAPAAKPILQFYADGGWNKKADEAYQQKLDEWMKIRQSLPLDPPPKPEPGKRIDDRHLRPAGVYNALIAPLAGLAFRGVVFDHGDNEQSVMHGVQESRLLPVLIADWRRAFANEAMTFALVELRPERFGKFDDRCGAELREGQSMAERELSHVFVANTVDLPGKTPAIALADRLARIALFDAYQRTDTDPVGPRLASVKVDGATTTLSFTHTGGGLVFDADKPRDIALASSMYRWVWADVKIDGDTLIVTAPGVDKPEGVRYAYQDLPDRRPTLMGKNGLPAAPFRTDTHPTYTGSITAPDTVDRYFTRKALYIENPRLPRVLIIGDSISGGYHEPLRTLLKDEANVIGEADGKGWRSMGPRCYTTTGSLANDQLKYFLASREHFDVITFNMGIHEFAAAQPGSEAAYAKRLEQVLAVFDQYGTKPIWVASTGTISDNLIPRFPLYLSNAQRYNAAAAKLMESHHVPIADLYALTQPHVKEWINEDHIHFNDEAKQAMAQLLAERIREALKR